MMRKHSLRRTCITGSSISTWRLARHRNLVVIIGAASVCLIPGWSPAQEPSSAVVSPGETVIAGQKPGGGPQAPGAAPGSPQVAGGPPGAPGAPGTPSAPGPNPTGGDSQPVKRSATPPEPPNKKEFDVRPDENGMVEFQFRNQAWPDILRWLAETSNLSLDWQELPNDYLNIATQRKQSLEDTRDLINRHLLARGYTMLELDGVIQVVKTAGVNVSLVPKVPAETLASLPPNRFVRTSFTLGILVAKDVVDEFKPMLSANGALNALGATNRLEAMDTAANLLEIYRVISEEESEDAASDLAREYELKFVRAVEAKEQLLSFLGVETKSSSSKKKNEGNSPQEMMMRQQQMQMEMQMQMQQANQPGGAKKAASDIYLVANIRRNSVIAHAPPDKMAIITAFIKRIDVPNENAANMQRLETRMKTYRLSSLDPEQFVRSIAELDALEPTTRLIPDEKNRAILAYASISDHLIISQTIERLDGSARDFEVISLRRLKAEDVAGTIKFLMVGEEKKKDNNRNRFSYYDYFGGGGREENNESNDKFRIGANVHDNQILLWANEAEVEEVTKLLTKLGEITQPGSSRTNVRMIDASRSVETKAYLNRLKEAWSKVSDNPLILPNESEFESEKVNTLEENSEAVDPKLNHSDEPKVKKETPTDSESKSADPISAGNSNSIKNDERELISVKMKSKGLAAKLAALSTQLDSPARAKATPIDSQQDALERGILSSAVAQDESPARNSSRNSSLGDNSEFGNEEASQEEHSVATKPITGPKAAKNIEIRFDEKGNLVLSGDDLDALDRLEEMMQSNRPPHRKYHVFYIEHTKPTWIEMNLKDYFKEEDSKKKESNPFMSWYFGFDDDSSKSENASDAQLGKSRKLKFISDSDTRSIVVMGADEQQLKTIESLIKLWDIPQKTNKSKLRYTKLVHVEHSKANSIVDAIKDAYRDLLSTNDKAFEKKGGAEGGSESKHDDSSNSVSASGGMSYNFTGRLSMGIEPLTNSIIVSAEGEDLLKLVTDMIKELDVAAQPSGAVQMIQLGGTNSAAMEQALKAMVGKKTELPPGGPGQPQNGQPQGNLPGMRNAGQLGGQSSNAAANSAGNSQTTSTSTSQN